MSTWAGLGGRSFDEAQDMDCEPCTPLVVVVTEVRFAPQVLWYVVAAAEEAVGEVGLAGGDAAFVVVGVVVTFAVAEAAHEAGDGVAQVQGDGVVAGGFDVGTGAGVGGADAVALGREGEVEGAFGEGVEALRHADVVDGLLTGGRDDEGLGVGEADVFGGEDDESADDEEGVLAGLESCGRASRGRRRGRSRAGS